MFIYLFVSQIIEAKHLSQGTRLHGFIASPTFRLRANVCKKV
jgi:hypothetical protein